jgi:ribonuclease D
MLHDELVKQNRIHWLDQECGHILKNFAPKVKEDPWRRTSGIHGVKVPRQLAVVRELWLTRNQLAKELDIAPGRLLPDSSIIFAARADSKITLKEMAAFQSRGAKTHTTAWKDALNRARELPDNLCPPSNPRSSAIPHPKNWAARNPKAHARLTHARLAISKLGESLGVSAEHLISPETLRTICWSKTSISEMELEREYLVRPWQISLILPDLTTALLATTPVATAPPEGE